MPLLPNINNPPCLAIMTRRSKLSLNKVILSLSCNSCMSPKQSDISHPKPRSSATTKKPIREDHSTNKVGMETTSESSHCHPYYESPRFGQMGGEGMAVEKDSNDPYLDFRRSMLQMIVENEMYAKDDLRELLTCFLQLNAPFHHGIIIKAFTDIWNGMFSTRSASPRFRRRKARQGAVI